MTWALFLAAWAGAILGPPAAAFAVWRWKLHRGLRGRMALGVFATFYVLGIWAFLWEPTTLHVRHVTVESAAWSGPPLRIGVISDTHVGAPHVDARRIEKLVERMNAENPDIVVLLGDYVGGHEPAGRRGKAQNGQILSGIGAFGGLKAPGGAHAVLGNHDWWYGVDPLDSLFQIGGVGMLQNQSVKIERPGAPFWIAGLSDEVSPRGGPSAAQALAGVAPGEPVIVLTHWPDPFAGVPPRVALTLAGHTHCGQVNFPIVGRLIHASAASKRWACGVYNVGGRRLYVSGGVGVSILPVRFGAPPEIAVITLKSPGT